MAVVVYKCNTCKREKQFVHNPQGLETVGRCTITFGCRGTLFRTNFLRDFQRTNLPDPVPGLDDWFARKVLHNHTQAIAQEQWTITHNMGTFPSVSAFVDRPIQGNPDNRDEVTPTDIVVVDENTVRLVFDRRQSGIAQLVARQSDPDLFDTESVQPETQPSSLQLTNNGELTLATLINTFNEEPVLTFDITYQPSSGSPITITHAVDLQPSIDSSWSDVDRVLIKGKIYKIRSVNIIDQIASTIPTGSAFRFTQVVPGSGTPQNIEKGQVLLLFADQPFGTVDKNTRQSIDVTSVTQNTNTFSLFYDSPELYARPDIVQQVFPPIRLL